jgi:hypothetical protein
MYTPRQLTSLNIEKVERGCFNFDSYRTLTNMQFEVVHKCSTGIFELELWLL